MTDIEAFVDAPGRADLVKQVRKKIDDLGIDYLYLQFVSVTGRIVRQGHSRLITGKRIAERGLPAGLRLDRSISTLDRHGAYIGYGPEASELVGIPDPETFCQIPWDKRVARVFCTLFPQPRRAARIRAAFLTSDCRGNLRRSSTTNSRQEHNGLHMQAWAPSRR